VESFPSEVRGGGQQEPGNAKGQCRKFAFQTMARDEKNRVCRTSQCNHLKHIPQVWSATEPNKWHEKVIHEHCMVPKDRKATNGIEPFAMSK